MKEISLGSVRKCDRLLNRGEKEKMGKHRHWKETTFVGEGWRESREQERKVSHLMTE